VRRAPLAHAAIGLTVAALLLSAASCEDAPSSITTEEVRRSTVVEMVDVPAAVTARAATTLTAPADGRLERLTVGAGGTVRAGDVIAVIDSPSARKRLADARAALAASRSTGRLRVADLSSAQRKLDTAATDAFTAARQCAGQIADEQLRAALLAQLDAAQASYGSAAQGARQLADQVRAGIGQLGDAVSALGAAQRIQAQSAVDLAQSTVDSLTVRAPLDGVVQLGGVADSAAANGSLDQLLSQLGGAGAGAAAATAGAGPAAPRPGVDDVVVVGDLLSAGAPIATVVDVSALGLVGEVDETDVLLVKPGVLADVELDAAPGVTYTAVVTSVDLLPTPSARGGVAYRTRLDLTGRLEPMPRPGMSAVAHLKVRQAADTVTVPASAVRNVSGRDRVWLVKDGVVVDQEVTVGVTGPDLVQVTAGLEPGQRVVTAGVDQVQPGMELP
jgi:HlyD family secretion protein